MRCRPVRPTRLGAEARRRLRRARQDRSGEEENFLGAGPCYFALDVNEKGQLNLVACRSDEFDMRKATAEEIEGFGTASWA